MYCTLRLGCLRVHDGGVIFTENLREELKVSSLSHRGMKWGKKYRGKGNTACRGECTFIIVLCVHPAEAKREKKTNVLVSSKGIRGENPGEGSNAKNLYPFSCKPKRRYAWYYLGLRGHLGPAKK